MEPQRNVTCSSVAYTTVIKADIVLGAVMDTSDKLYSLLSTRLYPVNTFSKLQLNVFFAYFELTKMYLNNENK